MKSATLSAIILIIVASCEDASENDPYQLSPLSTLISLEGKTYQESIDAWSALKETNGDSYVYQTTFTSWTGRGNTTEIRVDDGVVTTRIYQEFQVNQSDGKKIVDFYYREDGDDVGSHTKGAKPHTIDELYESCASEFLIADRENNTVYFETTDEGLMTMCGFVPSGCADDCYTGVTIDSFAWRK